MYKELLEEFQKAAFNKTGDWRADTGQVFLKSNPTAIHRAELIKEESLELIDALLLEDLDAVRKEICDLLYVVFGTVATYNLSTNRDFLKVHENNMLKIKTGTVREDGKLIKHSQHPRVIF